MKNPKILYILIGAFCVFAIIAGIYEQFINSDTAQGDAEANNEQGSVASTHTQEQLRSEFNQLFTNTINLGNFDTTGISKVDATKEIVYSAYDIDEDTENYEINIHIPVININNENAVLLNQNTQELFVNKANEVLQTQEVTSRTIYSIDYTAYVNNNILSLVIKSTLKEGNSPQRVIVQTYNYNLETNTQASLVDLITIKMLNTDEVNAKIKEVVTAANAEDAALQSMGYDQVYVRDLESNIYTVENASSYFLGSNGELYIVYAYGNSEFTSKMDIVKFD